MIFQFGKVLIFSGFLLILLGLILTFFGKIPFFGKLPGDILIQKKNFTFYFPLASCLILSLIISLVFYFFFKFLNK